MILQQAIRVHALLGWIVLGKLGGYLWRWVFTRWRAREVDQLLAFTVLTIWIDMVLRHESEHFARAMIIFLLHCL